MVSRYIDPTTDFGFKRLFGREESKDILKGFLFDILQLPHPITEIQYIPMEQLPDSPAERIGIYDIYCTDETGHRFIVEMQRSSMRYFKERALFYTTFPIIQQVEKGTTYDFSLLPVYCVNILRYKMDEEPPPLRRIQLMNTETCQVFYEGLTFVFVLDFGLWLKYARLCIQHRNAILEFFNVAKNCDVQKNHRFSLVSIVVTDAYAFHEMAKV